MLQKTEGIVLSRMPYEESSLIVKILTSELGLRSYIIKGVRKPTTKRKSTTSLNGNIFQPLHILDLVVYESNPEGLNHIKEAQMAMPLNISGNVRPATISFFLVDVISQCLKTIAKEPEIYSFIRNTVINLNSLQDSNIGYGLFPLKFLAQFASSLGYEIMNNYQGLNSKKPFFDLQKGCFVAVRESNNSFSALSESESLLLYRFLCSLQDNNTPFSISPNEKKCLFEIMLQFYYTHILPPNSIKSYPILMSILH